MTVHPWSEVDRIGEHPKIFVSRGTHGNYLTVGPHDLKPFTPGDINLNQGTCAQIETLDQVIPGGEGKIIPGESPDTWVLLAKGILSATLLLPLQESAWGSFGEFIPPMEPNKNPQDETGGPLFGLILRPEDVQFLAEQASAQSVEVWPTKMPEAKDSPRYDFIVDRDTQLWWAPRASSLGYAGRWGPRVTNDPKARRSGMRCPSFALMMLIAVANLPP